MQMKLIKAIPSLVEHIKADAPGSLLDAGTGLGHYGSLLMEILEDTNGEKKSVVDGMTWDEDSAGHLYGTAYNHLYSCNIESIPDVLKRSYDTILLCNVMENRSKEEGLDWIRYLLTCTNQSLIIVSPIHPSPKALSHWNAVDLVDFDYRFSQVKDESGGWNIFKLYPNLNKRKAEGREMAIGYYIPHLSMTGGMKMLLHQMEKLREKGHRITALFRGPEGSPVLPLWCETVVDDEILIPPDQPLMPYVKDCDIVVAGWIYQLPELKETGKPVFYWEQGHESLFGDLPDPATAMGIRASLNGCYRSGIPIVSVSEFVSRILKARYDITSPVITNGLDIQKYVPKLPEKRDDVRILLVGNPYLRFKAFDDAIKTLEMVWRSGNRFDVEWVCQAKPSINPSFPIKYNVLPSEETLISCYQQADIFLFTSWYEGFGMPPLEAMACGTPVIMTNCGGVRAYMEKGYNSLIAEPGDIETLARHVELLLKDEEKRRFIGSNGIKTAKKFSHHQVIPQLEQYMRELLRNF